MTHDEALMDLTLDQIASASRPTVAHGFLNPMGFVAMCRDIAERNRKAAQERLSLLSLPQLQSMLVRLDSEIDYCDDAKDGVETDSFRYVQADMRRDEARDKVTAVERELRQRLAGLDL